MDRVDKNSKMFWAGLASTPVFIAVLTGIVTSRGLLRRSLFVIPLLGSNGKEDGQATRNGSLAAMTTEVLLDVKKPIIVDYLSIAVNLHVSDTNVRLLFDKYKR